MPRPSRRLAWSSFARVVALLVMLLGAPVPGNAQETRPAVATRPPITLTAAQRLKSDSLVRAYATADAELLAAGDTAVQGRLSPTRRALRDELHEAIRALLTPAQRTAYDAWYTAARAAFEARRPPLRTRPAPP